jgi:hypothetical protein
MKGDRFMMTHEFDAWLDTQDIAEPDYHEQIALMHEYEVERIAALKQQGAKEALLALRKHIVHRTPQDPTGKYLAMHWTIDAINRQLSDIDIAKGGVL